ncbi:MAG: hypothetical protein PHT02_01200 [Tissierellia bacterium]|nr:hypothetical protein [Tissierellia bacterium]
MLTNIIRIGKSNYTIDQFTTAVNNSSRFTEVADKLGLNKQMSPHIRTIKDYIEQLQIDTSHFTYTYNKSENYDQKKQEHSKQYNITDNNRHYLEEFKNFFDKPACYINYKCTIANFMEFIQKDITEMSLKDMESFLSDTENENTRNNKTTHIKGILTYIVKNNVNDCCETISKDALIAIISM